MMPRGFACIALDRPKTSENVASSLRAAHAYGAAMVAVSGARFDRNHRMNTSKAHRHLPLLRVESVFDALPEDCVAVAVDILPGAIPLHEYQHPERAFYVFGAEDSTLSSEIVSRCRDTVYVPTGICMNLAAAVNVVLYDRLAKTSTRKAGA